jgi:hypothetical protein
MRSTPATSIAFWPNSIGRLSFTPASRRSEALLTLYGQGRGSGVEVRQEIAQLHTFQAGKVLRLVTYTDRAEALEAAGLPQ